MHRWYAAIVAGSVLAGCAHQPPPEPPHVLFAMFQKYCLATGGQYDLVAQAATADGFANNRDKAVLANILNIDSSTWQRKRDTVSIGPLHNNKQTADGKAESAPWEPPGAKAEFCRVSVVRDHDDSQAALAKWAAVPVWHSPKAAEVGDEISDAYNFHIENGKHVADAMRIYSADTLRTGAWAVTLYKRGNEYDMTIRHYYVPKP